MEKMNQEVKQKWVAALRSGEYTQGQGSLKNAKSEYCCLGVLCSVAKKEGLEVVEKYNTKLESYTFDGDRTFLPYSVRDWAQLSTEAPYVLVGAGMERLDHLNDSGDFSFDQIADLIEASL